jgi:serine/threonine protein kinase
MSALWMSEFHGPPPRVGNFVIGERLGIGTYAEVYKAEHASSGEPYAVKIFPRSNLRDDQDKEHLQREVDSMALLQCDSIVRLHHFSSDEKAIYIVMDFCAGGDLFKYIISHGKLEEPIAAVVFKQVAGAIGYCHLRGVAHRDIKPENILITEFPMVKLTDFGLCGYLKPEDKLQTFCGSPCYFAPEILSRSGYDGAKSDLWSLGVLLYVMVTGMLPWNPENESRMQKQILTADCKIPSTVSRECQDLIKGLLRVNPVERVPISRVLSHPWLHVSEYALVEVPEALERALAAIKALDLARAMDPIRPRPDRLSLPGIASSFVDHRRPELSWQKGLRASARATSAADIALSGRLANAAGLRVRRNPQVTTFGDEP